MASWSPPAQLGGRFGWWPDRPKAYQPNGPYGSPVSTRSVTLKRPVGVGVSAAPIAAANLASGRRPRINQIARSLRLARIQVLVRASDSPRRSIQPVSPFGRMGRTTRPQPPRGVVAVTHSQVVVPSGVDPGTLAITRPCGRAWTTAPFGVATSRKRGPSEARAVAGNASARVARSSTAKARTVKRRGSRTERYVMVWVPARPRSPRRAAPSYQHLTGSKHP